MKAQRLESALKQSIAQYTRIVRFLSKIEEEIGTASQEAIHEMNTFLTETSIDAVNINKIIISEYSKYETVSNSILTLMAEQENLINNIFLLNRNITTKAIGVKSLLAHEIRMLRNSQKALGGYKSNVNGHGRIINTAR